MSAHRSSQATALLGLFLSTSGPMAILAQPASLPGSQPETQSSSQPARGTRVTDPRMHVRASNSPRSWSDFVLAELDLRPGDVVVDVGAGDGWWAEKMAKTVERDGTVHAAEIDAKKIDEMRSKYSNVPQIRPYLCGKDSTCLPEGSCDMAFFCQSYHHLDSNGRVDYLQALKKVVKPTGRIVIVDKYSRVSSSMPQHAVDLSVLLKEAEEAGWILVRCEMLTGTQHYMATFVQKELFLPEATGRRRRV